MPVTVKTGMRNPLDSGGPLKLNIADQIDVVAPERDTPLLRLLGYGASAEEVASATIGARSLKFPCTSIQHTWLNDSLVPSEGTLNAAHTSGSGSLDVGATQARYFRVDDIVRVRSSQVAANVADVFFLVTAVNETTGILSVTALNADQNAASGDRWYLLGNAKKVGSTANTTGKYTQLSQTSNFTQIFSDDAVVTGSDESVEQYGITDPLAREVDKTFQRMIVEFERALHWNVRSSTLPSDSSTATRMGGLYYFLRIAPDNLSYDLGGNPISERILDDLIERIWKAGGVPDTILMNSVGLRELKRFNRPFTQTNRTERTAGLIVDRYESALGIALDVVLDRHLGDGDFVILTKDQIGVGPLTGNGNDRSFTAAEVPWDGGDYRRVNIRGEYTMEVRNHTTHHLWAYGGAVTVSS